jgi:hypothetical protein
MKWLHSKKPMLKYADYEGPQGDFAVIAGTAVPISDEALTALAKNAMLLALGEQANAASSSDAVLQSSATATAA